MCKERLEFEQVSSVDTAAEYCDRMIGREAGGGDVDDAMRRIEAKTGVNYWTLWGLRYRKPKTIGRDLFHQIRGAYLVLCERELGNLKHELSIETAKGSGDDFADLVAEAETLVAKLKAAKAASLKGGSK